MQLVLCKLCSMNGARHLPPLLDMHTVPTVQLKLCVLAARVCSSMQHKRAAACSARVLLYDVCSRVEAWEGGRGGRAGILCKSRGACHISDALAFSLVSMAPSSCAFRSLHYASSRFLSSTAARGLHLFQVRIIPCIKCALLLHEQGHRSAGLFVRSCLVSKGTRGFWKDSIGSPP